jgi:hypothetical protein
VRHSHFRGKGSKLGISNLDTIRSYHIYVSNDVSPCGEIQSYPLVQRQGGLPDCQIEKENSYACRELLCLPSS